MTNIFDTFVTRLEAFFETVKEDLVQFTEAFLPKVEHLLEVAFEDLAELAGKAVMEELPKVVSGSEKFGNAVTNVIQTVEASGKTIAIQTAQTAVQSAYLTAKEIVASK